MSVIDSLSLGGTTYSLRDNDGRAIIAGTESSTTSAHAYSAGDYFILNDTLYEATAAIAVGGTITVGTNCQATTVCGEVGELKSDFNAAITKHKNFLENAEYYDNYYWKRTSPLGRSSSNNHRAYYGIPVTSGKTYYYKHLFLYYTVVVYAGETAPTTLTTDTTQDISGTFTPSGDGIIYITVNKTYTPLFTDDEGLHNAASVESYYTPGKLIIETGSEADNQVPSAGYVDGKYLNSNGTLSSNSDFRTTNVISVTASTMYCLQFVGQCFVACYDVTGTFVSDTYFVYNSGNTIAKCKIKSPANVKYIRISYAKTNEAYIVFAKKIDGAEFHVGSNYPYKKVSEAINEAVKNVGEIVRIHEGTYDLYTEFGGSTFFDTYDHSNDGEGLVLKNRIKIIASSGSKIAFNYTGDNTEVKQYFSVFNAGPEGFTLEGLTVECSNCRYVVHDERYTANDMYNNRYKACQFSLDNSSNSYGYSQCIGGGLGVTGLVVIEDCLLKTQSGDEVLSYHNSGSSSANNKIIVSGCYCVGGTIRFSWYGSSTSITEILCMNNSVPSAIVVRAENASSTTENIDVKAWNNEIRSA